MVRLLPFSVKERGRRGPLPIPLSIREDFSVFAGTAEVEGCEETINEIVCDSTGVLSAVPPRGRALTTLMQGGPAENTASAGDSVWPLDTKFRVPIQFRR